MCPNIYINVVEIQIQNYLVLSRLITGRKATFPPFLLQMHAQLLMSAYACFLTNKTISTVSVDLTGIKSCDDVYKEYLNNTSQINVQVWQKFQPTIPLKYCSAQRSINSFHCNDPVPLPFTSIKYVNNGGDYTLAFEETLAINGTTCQEMHRDRVFHMKEEREHTIRLENNVTHHIIREYWGTRKFLRGECKGIDIPFRDRGIIQNSAAEALIDIELDTVEAPYNEETDSVVIGDLRCNFRDGECEDPVTHGVYTWDAAERKSCKDTLMQVHRGEGKLYSASSSSPQSAAPQKPNILTIRNDTEEQIMGLVLGPTTELCNKRVYQTQLDDIVVAVDGEMLEDMQEVDPRQASVDFSILGATHHFSLMHELSRDKIVQHTVSQMCRNSERSLRTSLALLQMANEAVPHIEGLDNEGLTFVTAGAAVNIVRCPKVTVTYHPLPYCVHEMPVSTPSGEKFFVNPFTKVLQPNGTVLPCSAKMPVVWLVDGTYYCSTPELQVCDTAPTRIAPHLTAGGGNFENDLDYRGINHGPYGNEEDLHRRLAFENLREANFDAIGADPYVTAGRRAETGGFFQNISPIILNDLSGLVASLTLGWIRPLLGNILACLIDLTETMWAFAAVMGGVLFAMLTFKYKGPCFAVVANFFRPFVYIVAFPLLEQTWIETAKRRRLRKRRKRNTRIMNGNQNESQSEHRHVAKNRLVIMFGALRRWCACGKNTKEIEDEAAKLEDGNRDLTSKIYGDNDIPDEQESSKQENASNGGSKEQRGIGDQVKDNELEGDNSSGGAAGVSVPPVTRHYPQLPSPHDLNDKLDANPPYSHPSTARLPPPPYHSLQGPFPNRPPYQPPLIPVIPPTAPPQMPVGSVHPRGISIIGAPRPQAKPELEVKKEETVKEPTIGIKMINQRTRRDGSTISLMKEEFVEEPKIGVKYVGPLGQPKKARQGGSLGRKSKNARAHQKRGEDEDFAAAERRRLREEMDRVRQRMSDDQTDEEREHNRMAHRSRRRSKEYSGAESDRDRSARNRHRSSDSVAREAERERDRSARNRQRSSDSVVREAEREYQAQRRSDPRVQDQEREYQAQRRNDPRVRDQEREYQEERRQDEELRERERSRQRETRRERREASERRVAEEEHARQQHFFDQAELQHQVFVEAVIALRNPPDTTFNRFETSANRQPVLITEAARDFYEELESQEWTTCSICKETYIFMNVGPRSEKCKRCAGQKEPMFADINDLNPTPAPPCLTGLTPIEKGAICRIAPQMAIYKKGASHASRGHCIHVQQDVQGFARVLPRLPQDLAVVYLKSQSEKIKDKTFEVRPLKIMQALKYLQTNNPYYSSIELSDDNMGQYELDSEGILQNVRQIDPAALRIPAERTPAAVADVPFDPSSGVDFPTRHGDVIQQIRDALQQPQGSDGTREPQRDGATNQIPIHQQEQMMLPSGNTTSDDLRAPQPGPHTTKIYWPEMLNETFLQIACATRNSTGLIETLAFVCGYKDADDNRHATHIIFPCQWGSESRVEDRGLNGEDTVVLAMQQLSQEIESPGKRFCVIAWVHSHVRGYPVNFSSIDLHQQQLFESALDSDILGVVFGVDERYPHQRKFDAFVMTSYGSAVVGECSRNHNLSNVQHDGCYHRAFYKSVKSRLVQTELPVNVLDGRNSQPYQMPPAHHYVMAVSVLVQPHEVSSQPHSHHQDEQFSQNNGVLSQHEMEVEMESQSQRLEDLDIGEDVQPAGAAREEGNRRVVIDAPSRTNVPVSETITGFQSMSYPDLFPDGKGEHTR